MGNKYVVQVRLAYKENGGDYDCDEKEKVIHAEVIEVIGGSLRLLLM